MALTPEVAALLDPEALACAIPAFEAAPSIGDVVRRALRFVKTVLVVDDGSTDGTSSEARKAGADVIMLPTNRGKGFALATAFDELFGRGYEAVVTVDADGQHLPEEIPVLLAGARSGADLVLGSRESQFVDMAPVREWSNRLSSRAISMMAGAKIPDTQTGFRIYTAPLIRATGFPESGFEAESAVLVRAVRQKFRIAAPSVRLGFADGRTTSHYRPFVDSLRIARAVLNARLRG